MRTEDLITALAADTSSTRTGQDRAWTLAILGSVVLAGLVFFATIGPRADLMAAVQTLRFDFKFVLTLSLALSGFMVLRAAAVPGARVPLRALLIAPVLGFAAVGTELMALPAGVWAMAAVGKNMLVCLTFIPLISLAPVLVLTLALRNGAPTRPALSGALVGLTAGAIGATFYAAHCTDDSPLFVMVWYPIAIALVTAMGAALGRLFVRW
ncbi:NrsF family protein [Pelagibacterium montanilacus]|uniref:NrsF family protein n=1 Tax=Pelagibacterium montanilacus TaxID=2185280 RepID=UPI000F8DC12F|nr:NrsF family protein [Pelagibacterium montanilacus]